jgi:8-oxo-dGTP pyrophosphatase MutT (NUDIX family)
MSIQEKENFRIIGAAHVIFERDGKICMLRRVNTGWMDGKYGFPAGHKETGESFLECAIREAKEEVGVDVQEKNL